MTFTNIQYSVSDGIAQVTLNLPAKMNPLTIAMQQELLAAYAMVRADRSVQALVLTGAGKAFCVGADLESLGDSDATGQSAGNRTAEMMNAWTNRLVSELEELPVPIVAAVNGAAAGAGVGLALAADVVVAGRSADFYLPFLPRLGIAPDIGTTWVVPRLVGRARFMGMALLDERLNAERAAQWGLVWSCVEDAVLEPEAHGLAKRLAMLPAGAAVEARRAYAAAQHNDLPQQLAYETERQRLLIDRAAFAEGVAAFRAKRRPLFKTR
jgi:2-(1,2-epoxy-1,2-dihydrophenyl)acetyl-CoA isomerase